MNVSSPMDKNHPLMIAWDAWQETAGYKNALGWAESMTVRFSVTDPPVTQSHASGSLWAAFVAGFEACAGRSPVFERIEPTALSEVLGLSADEIKGAEARVGYLYRELASAPAKP